MEYAKKRCEKVSRDRRLSPIGNDKKLYGENLYEGNACTTCAETVKKW